MLTQVFKTTRSILELFNERDNDFNIINHPNTFCIVLGNRACNSYSRLLQKLFDNRNEFFITKKAAYSYSLWDAGMMFLSYDTPYYFKLDNTWGRSEICQIMQYAVNHLEPNTLDIMIIVCNKMTKENAKKHDCLLDVVDCLGKPREKEEFDKLLRFASFGVRLSGSEMVVYDFDYIKEAAINFFNLRYTGRFRLHYLRRNELKKNTDPSATITKQDDNILIGDDFVRLELIDDGLVLCYNMNLKGAEKKERFIARLLGVLQYGESAYLRPDRISLFILLSMGEVDGDLDILEELERYSAFNVKSDGNLATLQTTCKVQTKNATGSYGIELKKFMKLLKTGSYVKARENCFISTSYLNTFSVGSDKESFCFVHLI